MAVFLFGRSSGFSVSPNFGDNSWAEIVKACRLNKIPDTWRVGDYKMMTIGDADYRVDIIGKNHDIYADGTGVAPLTFQLHDTYNTTYKMNDTSSDEVSWTSCAMRTKTLPALLAVMPPEVQAGVREVHKLTCATPKNKTIITTADKLFLLSEYEVFGSISQSLAIEGTKYAYYDIALNRRKKGGTGGNNLWWNRSPAIDYRSFCRITSDGEPNFYPADAAFYVSFAFCF